MCMGGSNRPTPPEKLPEAAVMPEAPTESSVRTTQARDKKRRTAATGQGRSGTILTGPRGVTQSGATAIKTLLGE